MTESQCILSLFSNVCDGAIFQNQISENEIKSCIENMKETYNARRKCLTSSERPSSNYADIAHRCAYLHKYAPFHTVLTCKMLRRAFFEKRYVFEELLQRSCGDFFLCSLGGGPGTDVIAVTALLHEYFGHNISVIASVLDSMPEWGRTFAALHNELRTGNYGCLSQYYGAGPDWRYLGVNLLDLHLQDKNVADAIATADMVTMVKFVSAAACKDTSAMLQNIFHLMKPGALILYIDNATAKFHSLIMEAAKEVQLETVFGPLEHLRFENDLFKVIKFGYSACSETTVNVHILQKPFQVIDVNSTGTRGKGVKRKAGCFGETNIAKKFKARLKQTKQFFKRTKKGIGKKIGFKNKKPLLSYHSYLSPYQQKDAFYHNIANDGFSFKTRFEDINNNDCKLPYFNTYPIHSPIGWSPDYRERSILPHQFTPLRSPLSSNNYPTQNLNGYTPGYGNPISPFTPLRSNNYPTRNLNSYTPGLNSPNIPFTLLSSPLNSNNYSTENLNGYTPGYRDPNSPFTPLSSKNNPTQNLNGYTPGYGGANSPFTPLSPWNLNLYSNDNINCYTTGDESLDSPSPFYCESGDVVQKKLYF